MSISMSILYFFSFIFFPKRVRLLFFPQLFSLPSFFPPNGPTIISPVHFLPQKDPTIIFFFIIFFPKRFRLLIFPHIFFTKRVILLFLSHYFLPPNGSTIISHLSVSPKGSDYYYFLSISYLPPKRIFTRINVS